MKITRKQLRNMIKETMDQNSQGMTQQSAKAQKGKIQDADEVLQRHQRG